MGRGWGGVKLGRVGLVRGLNGLRGWGCWRVVGRVRGLGGPGAGRGGPGLARRPAGPVGFGSPQRLRRSRAGLRPGGRGARSNAWACCGPAASSLRARCGLAAARAGDLSCFRFRGVGGPAAGLVLRLVENEETSKASGAARALLVVGRVGSGWAGLRARVSCWARRAWRASWSGWRASSSGWPGRTRGRY